MKCIECGNREIKEEDNKGAKKGGGVDEESTCFMGRKRTDKRREKEICKRSSRRKAMFQIEIS